MNKNIIYLLWLVLIGFSCSKSSQGGDPAPAMFFRGGMDSVTISPDPNDKGNLKFNGWSSLKKNQNVESFGINNGGGSAFAYQDIVNDPVNSSEKVMHAVVVADDPSMGGVTRAQTTLTFKDGVLLDVYHTSIRMFFHQDVAYLLNYPDKISWFDIFETWNAAVSSWGGDVAGSARWNLQIFKDAGGSKFYWVAAAETMEPTRTTIWSVKNNTVAIPINKWFTMDVYLKRGEGTNGKFTIKMTVDGESTATLFDINDTTIYPGHSEIQLKSWQAFKFYFDSVYLDWINTNDPTKTLQCFYNDFKWYKN